MKKPRLSKRFLLFTALALTVTMLLAAAGVVTYAYFSTQPRVFTDDNTSQAARVGMRINLLFENCAAGKPGTFPERSPIPTETKRSSIPRRTGARRRIPISSPCPGI